MTAGGITPGPERRLEFLDGDDALVIRAVELVEASGAASFELRHDEASLEPGAGDDDTELEPGTPYRWHAIATYRVKARGRRPRDRRVVGSSDATAYDGDHRTALRTALTRLLRELGVGVELLEVDR